MSLFKLDLKPALTDLRWFAGLWFPAFCGMTGWFAFRHHAHRAAFWIWGVALVWSLAGLLLPRLIRPAYVGLMCLTFPLGWVMSKVLVLVAWFVVMSPIGALVRVFHDPMQRHFDSSAKSYWLPWEPSEPDSYFRQL